MRQIHSGFTLDARHTHESDANVARTQQGMFLLDPSVPDCIDLC
jgi:hypothetical protein